MMGMLRAMMGMLRAMMGMVGYVPVPTAARSWCSRAWSAPLVSPLSSASPPFSSASPPSSRAPPGGVTQRAAFVVNQSRREPEKTNLTLCGC
eukprot:4490246-Pyramimonas_sp.AAC.1